MKSEIKSELGVTVSDTIRLLIVDDRPENLLTLENIIDSPSRMIIKASSGNEALKYALSNPVDLILLDVQMPDMDGFEVADLLRLNQKTKKIPIIFVSAISRGERDAAAKYEDGSVDFLYKPLDIKETRSKVALFEQLIRLQKRESIIQKRMDKQTRDFESFVYIVSHDIKAPLRAIDNLAGWIMEDLGNSVSGETKENIQLIQCRTKRLQGMLDGLTEYSRISRLHEAKEMVQLSNLVHAAAEMASLSSNFLIHIPENMPSVQAERNKLLKIFYHLIQNAMIHHHQERGEIFITYSRLQDWIEFTVSDDGPGIKPQFREKVFELFHTLKPKDQCETAGAGLTIVKSLVESAGGTIKIDESKNGGTSVIFSWPSN